MTTDWRECSLGDLLQIKHGYAFLGQHFGSDGTHVVLTPGNFLEEGGFKENADKAKWYSGPIPQEYVLSEGDLIVAMTEQAEGLLGSSALIPRSDIYLHNQRLGLVQIRHRSAVDSRFVYYLFNTAAVRQQIRASASGTKIRHTAPSRIQAVRVRIPPIATQRRIAGLLASYDEFIETSQRRIDILETMARALFREWFVELRFPGHEHHSRTDSPHSELPKGWNTKPLGSIAEHVRRNMPKGELDEPVHYVGLEHIPRRSLALNGWEMATSLGSNKLAFSKGDVLFGKIRPYFHKVSVAPFEGVCSADTIVIRARRPEHSALVTAYVSGDAFVAEASATANGAKMPRASWEVLRSYQIAVPPDDLASRFEAAFGSMIAQQQLLVKQIRNLRSTRDLLIPRLLSGQIDPGAD